MMDSKKGFIPLQQGVILSKKDSPSRREQREYMSKISYASTIGSIMYAMLCTRLAVAHALSMTSRFQQNPGEKHWTVVKKSLST